MPETLRASHAIEIPDSAEGLAEWYHLLPSGTFHGRDGRGPYIFGKEEASSVMAASSRLKCLVPVDYEHQSLDAREKSGPVPAAGWIKGLHVREDGLWARIEWTPAARACLENKEYRYLSPVFIHDKAGHVKAITMAALTNTPNLHLTAAAGRELGGLPRGTPPDPHAQSGVNPSFATSDNKGVPMDELRERLCFLLNLPLTATDEELSVHLDRLKELVTSETETVEAASRMRKGLGLGEKATMPEIALAVQARLSSAPDPAKYVPMEMYQSLNSRITAMEQSQASEKVESLVQEAMSAGKVTPAQKSWAVAYASSDPNGFRAFLNAAPVVVSGNSQETGKPESSTGVLTPEQKQIVAAMGIDPAKYLETVQTSDKEDM